MTIASYRLVMPIGAVMLSSAVDRRRAGGRGGSLGLEPSMAVERPFVLRDRPSEVDLERRRCLVLDQRVMRGEVVDVEHDQAGFDPGNVERPDSGRRDAIATTHVHDRV